LSCQENFVPLAAAAPGGHSIKFPNCGNARRYVQCCRGACFSFSLFWFLQFDNSFNQFSAEEHSHASFQFKVFSRSRSTAHNMALPQYWRTVIFSTLFRYQSFVIGLTEN
jgi:hypothetical protein